MSSKVPTYVININRRYSSLTSCFLSYRGEQYTSSEIVKNLRDHSDKPLTIFSFIKYLVHYRPVDYVECGILKMCEVKSEPDLMVRKTRCVLSRYVSRPTYIQKCQRKFSLSKQFFFEKIQMAEKLAVLSVII